MTQLLGIDTGGTFTDFILYKNGKFSTQKILSTPHAPEQAILQGLRTLDVDIAKTHFVHGTTVATNALLEGKGARTAFITNRGCKDLLHIGRQTRDQLYSLCPQPPRELIPSELCFEVAGRIAADGQQLEHATIDDIQELKKRLAKRPVDAVAICMLFSFLNDEDELALAVALEDQYFVSRSSQLLPEQREYERAVVTWLNSYLGPHTQRYLSDLKRSLVGSHVHVMQSDATTSPVNVASKQAVKLLLSGPAGGVVAATTIAARTQHKRLLTFDMGGTSTDVALIDGQAVQTTEGRVAEFPLAVSMLDIHTIGAGGGSVAWVDQAGVLHVGPASAGADPGPACYGRGGKLATITDANVVLGRLPVTRTWASGLRLHKPAAERCLLDLAQQMDCSMLAAAQGIIALANAHMVQALRVISIQRGHDPSDFCLFPFGGAGALHMCEVAEQLGVQQILIPANAGILSAYGMLHAPIGQLASRSICRNLAEVATPELHTLLTALETQASEQLRAVGLHPHRFTHWVDVRYQGQSTTISIEWIGTNNLMLEFSQAHQDRFGFQLLDHVVELVTIRVWAYQDIASPPVTKTPVGVEEEPLEFEQVAGYSLPTPVFNRTVLVRGQQIVGPAIVLEESATLFICAGWRAVVEAEGHIYLQRGADGQ